MKIDFSVIVVSCQTQQMHNLQNTIPDPDHKDTSTNREVNKKSIHRHTDTSRLTRGAQTDITAQIKFSKEEHKGEEEEENKGKNRRSRKEEREG